VTWQIKLKREKDERGNEANKGQQVTGIGAGKEALIG
jgi:hypothetical protein